MKTIFRQPLITVWAKFPTFRDTCLSGLFKMFLMLAAFSPSGMGIPYFLRPSPLNKLRVFMAHRPSALLSHIVHVAFLVCYKKVVWVYTHSVVTMMAHKPPLWNRAATYFIHSPVRRLEFCGTSNAVCVDFSVSTAVFATGKIPASGFHFFNFFHESFFNCFHGNMIAKRGVAVKSIR